MGHGLFTTLVAVLVASCSSAESEDHGSLNETIEIVQTHREVAYDDIQMLSYELKPGNTLSIVHLVRGSDDRILGTDEFQLTDQDSSQIREALNQFRPKEFHPLLEPPISWPEGCENEVSHPGCEISVLFHNTQGTAENSEDDLFAVFALPLESWCENDQTNAARNVLSQVLEQIPESEIAADFPSAL